MSSSPDPLNDSPYHSHQKTRPKRVNVRQSFPMGGSSPKKQTFQLDVGNEVSPQKIRVTVEADNSDEENLYTNFDDMPPSSPSRALPARRRERTTTTIVPLKGLSDDEERDNTQIATPKRGRGRPRKTGTPIPAKKRAGTPIKKSSAKRKSIGDLVDGDDEGDIDFRLSQAVEIDGGKAKRKSRSRSAKEPGRNLDTAVRLDCENDAAPVKKGRGLRKSLVPENGGAQGLQPGSKYPDEHEEPDEDLASGPTSEGEEEHILLARFDPGNETPQRPGWSSPREMNSGRPSSSTHRADSYPSPSTSHRKSDSGDEEDGYESVHYDENDFEADENDTVGGLRDFDTVVESENFSMINMESILSLRDHLKSPSNRFEDGGSKPSDNGSNLSLHHRDAEISSAVPLRSSKATLETATPAREIQNPNLLSVQIAQMNDSFSSIPPEVLEAATPGKGLSKNTVVGTKKQSNQEYEDSFSAIPPAILEAATPAVVRQDCSTSDKLSVPGPRSSVSPSRKTQSPRLLTPEETPSPPTEPNIKTHALHRADQEPLSTGQSIPEAVQAESSILHSQLPSSPPEAAPRRYTYTAHLRQHRHLDPNMTQTPSIVFSSPALPPPLHPARDQQELRPTLDHTQRPTLSPIARSGRALQDIIIPSSPRSRSQSLGSPFKSPASERRSSSIVPAAEPVRLAGPLPRLDLSSQFSDRTSQESSQQSHKSSSAAQDDPFRNTDVLKERSPSPPQEEPYSLGMPSGHPRSGSLKMDANSFRSESAMSWQAEEVFVIPQESNPKSSSSNTSNPRRQQSQMDYLRAATNNMTSEQRWQAERNEVKRQIAESNPKEVVTIDSEDEADHAQEEDDEDFGLLLETLNSSSPAAQSRPEPTREVADKPKRSKIPSPWRQNSKRLVYSDEISQFSSSPVPSMANKNNSTQDAQVPGSQPVTVRHVGSQRQSEDDNLDLSQFPIPQKSNFKPRPRESGHLDLSAILGASPDKPLPVFRSNLKPAISTERPSLDRDVPSVRDSSIETVSMPQKPLKTGFTPIPQKMGFNPRRSSSPLKQPSVLPSSSRISDGPSQDASLPPGSPPRISKPLASSSPNRANLTTQHTSHEDDTSSTIISQDSLRSSQVSPDEKENQRFDSRVLDWTKSLRMTSAAAGTETPPMPPPPAVKSILRSPLKTPTTSTFSGTSNPTPSKAVAFVSSSPMPSSPSPYHQQLSSTTWSKDHWRALDEIVQNWKVLTPGAEQKRRRNSTRVISRLLGKTVRSQGESMIFEQWHLEAVDEFRGMVAGWKEDVVAMRVFALIVGEERRSRGETSEEYY